jgi:cob(I)alamin adenosyltransferase
MIQVYTGDGKGKTTAAIGLAVRAAGAGMRIFIAQFVKGRQYSELSVLGRIPQITLCQFGRRCFIRHTPRAIDIRLAQEGFAAVEEAVRSRRFRMIILDELTIALHYRLLPLAQVMDLLKNIPAKVEVVITGRNCPAAIIRIAHLVSHIKEVKHPYQRGVRARRGIEM